MYLSKFKLLFAEDLWQYLEFSIILLSLWKDKKKAHLFQEIFLQACKNTNEVANVFQLLLTSNLATIVPVDIFDALKMYLPLSRKLKWLVGR